MVTLIFCVERAFCVKDVCVCVCTFVRWDIVGYVYHGGRHGKWQVRAFWEMSSYVQ